MRKSKIGLLLIVLMFFSLLTYGCNTSKVSNSKEPIVIGATFTLSGPVAHAGQQVYEGAELAVKYVNEELGGINGREVVLKYYDDEFDYSIIPMLYEKLITQDKVDLLISPYTSAAQVAAPVAAKHNALMFGVAVDTYGANEAFGQNLVNIQMDEEWKGGRWWLDVANFFANFDKWNHEGLEKPKTMAILNLEIAYGHDVADTIIPVFENAGYEIVYDEYFAPHVSDWTPIISRLKELQPDIVMQPHYFEDTVTFIEKCIEMDYWPPYMISEGPGWDPIAWTNPELGGLDSSIAKRPGIFSYGVYKDLHESESKDYLHAYTMDKYGNIPGNDFLCGFMAVELAAKAANLGGSIDKDDMIKTMVENTITLAGYDYKMNETGGNVAEFYWGVSQYIPDDINNTDTTGDDWYCIWPEKYATSKPAYPLSGWE